MVYLPAQKSTKSGRQTEGMSKPETSKTRITCSRCGREKEVSLKANGDTPTLCSHNCKPPVLGICVVCGETTSKSLSQKIATCGKKACHRAHAAASMAAARPRSKTRVPKTCPVCAKEFVPSGFGETAKKQVTCSATCMGVRRSRQVAAENRPPKVYIRGTVAVTCSECGVTFTAAKKGETTAKFCSLSCAARRNARLPSAKRGKEKAKETRLLPERVQAREIGATKRREALMQVRVCPVCNIAFSCLPGARKTTCSVPCRNIAAGRKMKGTTRGKNPACSERMRKNNPSFRPEVRAKMSASMQGRTFLSRGGNGKLTRQQVCLSEALNNAPMEYPIRTAEVAGMLPTLPPCYKVDVALPEYRLAIEVDGRSHNSPKWRFLDRRKESVLVALGWLVFRCSNKEVDFSVEEVVSRVRQACMTSKCLTPTVTSLKES